MKAHLRNCEGAGKDAHEPENSLEVKGPGEIENIGAYLFTYFGKSFTKSEETPAYIEAFDALLWATGAQRFRPSKGAQRYMKQDPADSEKELELVGISPSGEESDVIPQEDWGLGRSVFVRVGRPPPVSVPPGEQSQFSEVTE